MNQELLAIFQEDQADRRGDPRLDIAVRDEMRRQRVEELIAAGALRAPEDYFHAAIVFQHGGALEHYWRAHELAKKAADLGHRQARWLAAAAYDRWLMRQGKPQKYGTQYVVEGGRWRLHDVDPATTDTERAEWGVPPLEAARQRAEELTRARPPARPRGPLVGAIGWLAVEGLRVEVIPVDQVATPPPPELLGSDERAPVPAGLPPGLEIRRRGGPGHYCAVAPGGAVVVFWDRAAVPVAAPFVYGWRWPREDLILEPVEAGGRPAIRIGGAGDGLERLVLRADPTTCWLVGGRLAREDLARIAAGLVIGDEQSGMRTAQQGTAGEP